MSRCLEGKNCTTMISSLSLFSQEDWIIHKQSVYFDRPPRILQVTCSQTCIRRSPMGMVEWPFNKGWPKIQVDQKMTCIMYIVHNICPNSPTKKYNLLCVFMFHISNSPFCLSYSSCDVSLENLVLDQLIIP